MLDTTIYKDLKLSDRLDVAFPDKRIPNGFHDKTKTRVGITYMSFHDTRNSINVIPGEAIIQDALEDYPYLKLFDVRAGVTSEHVKGYLQSNAKYKRLVTTPESFRKIINAAISINKLQWLYDNFFLYLDEVHCYATETFRVDPRIDKDDILTPFDPRENYVWKFKDMSMGSATPFKFSDPRIEALPHYKLRYKEKFGKISIIHDSSPIAALHYMLLHPEMFPGNVHIFFNTVTECGAAIRATGITDANIYCRDVEKNMANLEEAVRYFRPKPVKDNYAKFNFYSCRYNDGWDLKDDETATIILVTDVNIHHSLIGIPFKGFQAVGRLKVKPHNIYHITNSYGKGDARSFETIQKKWLYNSTKQIDYYNQHAADCKADGIEDNMILFDDVKQFSSFPNGIAQTYHMKLDQIICIEYCNEHYNNLKTIIQTWESINYNTEVLKFDLAPVIRTKTSKEDVNRQIIARYEQLQSHPEEYCYEVATATVRRYQTEFQLLFDAYLVLGPDEIERLQYNDKAMKAALISKSNNCAEAKLRLLLIDTFKLKDKSDNIYANRYTNKFIKTKLQELYDLLKMRKSDGTRKIATAEHLKEYGLFQLDECKALDVEGKRKPGMEVIRENYTLSQAA